MTKEQQALIDRINELCKEKGYSYYALNYKSGVPLSTILHIIDGTSRNPGIFTIMKLCEAFEITMEDFFGTDAFNLEQT